jgi:hypothetical protein
MLTSAYAEQYATIPSRLARERAGSHGHATSLGGAFSIHMRTAPWARVRQTSWKKRTPPTLERRKAWPHRRSRG